MMLPDGSNLSKVTGLPHKQQIRHRLQRQFLQYQTGPR